MAAETRQKQDDAHHVERSPSSDSSSATQADEHSRMSLDTDEGEHQRAAELHALARISTQGSISGHTPLFPVRPGTILDPNSPDFDARAWAKAYYKARAAASDQVRPRTSGLAFKNLDAYGYSTGVDAQRTVPYMFLNIGEYMARLMGRSKKQKVEILRDFEGIVRKGEMLCVLGPPGSGCSTLLRTIAGDTYGFHIGKKAYLNYQGIKAEQMNTAYRGEAIYTAETDHHFPHLTVGETLYFAALARCPKNMTTKASRHEYAEHIRDVTMAMFGISHTKDTRVGNDFIRGVSGGERKRVTISEAALGYSPLQCWDNSTRGLDSANAVEFCRTLRTQADTMGCTSCVSLYQAPQAAYEVFDKVIVLYEGRQIFFGKADEARAYFENLGFICPGQQTTPDFLTSMTSPTERVIRPGMEGRTPRTPDEFAEAWKKSACRASLMDEIERYADEHPFDGQDHEEFLMSRRSDQSSAQRKKSPFNLSVWQQIQITLWRSWVLLLRDPSTTLTMLVCNFFEAIVIASIFYNLPANTTSFFRRTTLLFFVVLMNALGGMLEIILLYAKRKIVEKHWRYAFYHPSTEAIASMIVDLPYKFANTLLVNLTIYFMCNLRREPGPFFFFYLVSFLLVMVMSMLFRLMGSLTKTLEQAMAPSSLVLLALVLYCGFSIPPNYMQVWLGWLRWINPVFYGLESVFLNEFVGRNFTCSSFAPQGPGYTSTEPTWRVCTEPGSVAGQSWVEGGAYLEASFGFVNSHRWRNIGIIIALTLFFLALHLLATEYISSEHTKGEVLIFTRKALKKQRKQARPDTESGTVTLASDIRAAGDSSDEGKTEIARQTSVFHWKDVCYDIKVKDGTRRILDRVDGWVKPGTLTALMGVSGAGKTTLLDVLASRVTMGVVTGEMLVDGYQRDASFQRQTGYVQQQDLHGVTSTVREALEFSARLRQPSNYTEEEKIAYVDTVIDLLDMGAYADAIVGQPGEGLNVEQRKRLTIGVELAARPQLLLFLDEPTSGLDSQTSWSICNLMEKLTKNGQAILCTVHQPSAMLFQRFDRLLLLAKGGKTVYFGPIGKDSVTLMDYFTRNGGPPCPDGANPAEHMLEVIGAAPRSHTEIDWPQVWRDSPEYQGIQEELTSLSTSRLEKTRSAIERDRTQKAEMGEFAAPFSHQLRVVTSRLFKHYWRSPGYIWSKMVLTAGAALFIGLSLINSDNTRRGLQNQMFSIFIFMTVFAQIANQIAPFFCDSRTLYEARERPSKAYSWKAFMASNFVVELAWNSLAAVFAFLLWYFPVGLYRNAEWTDRVNERGITTLLIVWVFFMMAGSFEHMLIAGLPSPELAGGVFNLFFILMFAFCGVLAGPDQLPGFWIFMLRVNPLTYAVEGLLGTTLADAPVQCAANEIVRMAPAGGATCGEYLAGFVQAAGGYIVGGTENSTQECQYCGLADTNAFLAGINMNFGNRWRDFGFLWAYIIFNLSAALFFYWLVRVPKTSKKAKKE